jgi:hypothetical protein
MGRGLVCAAALLTIAACGDDGTGPDGGIPAELVATWSAGPACAASGCALVVFARADPSRREDFVASGFTVDMTVQSSGRLRMQVVLGTGLSLLDGSLRVETGQLIISGTTVDTLDYTLSGDFLEVELRSQFSRDFGLGVEPAGLRGKFLKQ